MSYSVTEVRTAIANTFWKRNDLRFKFKPAQLEMHNAIRSNPAMKYCIKCSRRLGKTFWLCAEAVMCCLNKEGAMVRYAAPTNKALKKFIVPVMRRLLEDCPEEKKPDFLQGDGVFRFKNGSEIHLAGVNNDNADSLRGPYADLFIIDEAGFVDDLAYLIDDVAMPQFLDPDGKIVKGRRLLISGSPARTPAHEFTNISRQAEMNGNFSHYDIYAGGYPEDTIEEFKKECGGENSTTWKREYLALDVVDENFALVPEWKSSYVEEPRIDEFFRFYRKYVSLDIGVRDLTVALFAHYDFSQAKLYIHEEVVLSGPQMTTERLAREIREAEARIFGTHLVHKRVSDIDLLLLNDLRALHQLYFAPTDKGKLEEMVNEVRIWVNAGRVIVSPKCKLLAKTLAYGVWNEKRTEFERMSSLGHMDAIASLMYLIRNVDQNINPIPPTYGKSEQSHFIPDEFYEPKKQQAIRKAFGVK